MKSTVTRKTEPITFSVLLHIRIFTSIMTAVSLVGSWLSLNFLFYMFDALSFFGNLPVPNIPILLFGSICIIQSIVLIFFSIYFATIFSLELQVTPERIVFTSYWYRLESPLDNISGVNAYFSVVGEIPVLLLKSPATPTSRRGKKGMYRLDPTKIPVGLFGTLDKRSLLGRELKRIAPELID